MKTGVPSLGGIARGKIERTNAIQNYLNNPKACKQCFKIIEVKEEEKVSSVKLKQFCNSSCAAKFNNRNRKRVLSSKKFIVKVRRDSSFKLRTKLELFSSRKNWQSARSSIRRHAERVWNESGQKRECSVCGYSLYVEIAHKKAVSDFSDDATIQDINSLDNLMALCPNHHWEFDHSTAT
jgi:predicted restriction endonuclease